jgi:hypothetical protein
MTKIVFNLVFLILLHSITGCAEDVNVYDCEEGQKELTCSETSAKDTAMALMKQGAFDEAIVIYLEIIEADDVDYGTYSLLGAAYAGQSGFRIFDIALGQVTAALVTQDGDLFDQMATLVPSPQEFDTAADFSTSITQMKSGVTILNEIPEALRTDTENYYSTSATSQLTLYQSAYSIMYMSQFTSNTDGALSEEELAAKLETMTAEDAAEILASLRAAGSDDSEDSEKINEGITKALDDIDGQEGASDTEKLQAFISKENE